MSASGTEPDHGEGPATDPYGQGGTGGTGRPAGSDAEGGHPVGGARRSGPGDTPGHPDPADWRAGHATPPYTPPSWGQGPYPPDGYTQPFSQQPYGRQYPQQPYGPQYQQPPQQYQQYQNPYGRPEYAYAGQGHPVQRSRVLAGILGILLGAFGIHRFYLGHVGIGVTMLLMSTVGSFLTLGLTAFAAGIWGLVEGIMILVGSERFRRDARGVPLRD